MKIHQAIILAVLLTSYGVNSYGQVHSQSSFRYVNLVNSARVAGMGGNLINVKDNDLSLAYFNPALLNPSMDNQAVFSFVSYVAKSNYGMFSYAKNFKNVGTFAVNLQYVGHGEFDETDNTGAVIGTFKANQTSINLSGGFEINERFSAGAQLKFLFSDLAQYNAFGMGIDLAGTYNIKEQFLTTSLVFKNIGYQFTSYYDNGEKEPLPFEIQIGISKKMKHAPFRLSFVLDNLQKWDLTYTDPNLIGKTDPLTGEPIEIENAGFGKQFLLHTIYGLELVFSKSIMIQLGYNYRRRDELRNIDKSALSGFSFGVDLKFGPVRIGYSLAGFNQAGSVNYFNLALFFNEMKKEKVLN
jgi:hypothetical protein